MIASELLGLVLNRRVLAVAAVSAAVWWCYSTAYNRGADAVQARWDAAASEASAKRSTGAVQNAQQSVQVVTEYVEKKVYVDRPTVVDRLVRVCDDAGTSRVPAPRFDPVGFADAANRKTLNALAGEAVECIDDSERFAALQRIVREQCL